MDKDIIVLLAARASRLENQDAIDTAIISMLADPKEVKQKFWYEFHSSSYNILPLFFVYEVKSYKWFLLQARANITEVHFFPFNPVDKRTAITYIDSEGNWYRASKGAPEQVLALRL